MDVFLSPNPRLYLLSQTVLFPLFVFVERLCYSLNPALFCKFPSRLCAVLMVSPTLKSNTSKAETQPSLRKTLSSSNDKSWAQLELHGNGNGWVKTEEPAQWNWMVFELPSNQAIPWFYNSLSAFPAFFPSYECLKQESELVLVNVLGKSDKIVTNFRLQL